MNALLSGEELTIDEYTVTFGNPQSYTLIQIKKDPYTPIALCGGLITLLGLFLAFYLQPAWMRARREEPDIWLIEAACHKQGAIFGDRLRAQALSCSLAIKETPSQEEERNEC